MGRQKWHCCIIALAAFLEASLSNAAALGLAGGLSLSSVSTTNYSVPLGAPAIVGSETLSGASYAFAATLSLFQGSLLGVELGADFVNMSMSSGADSFQANLLAASALGHFTFHWFAHYHQLGGGYARGNLLSPVTSPPTAIPKTMNGFVIEGKDYLIAEKRSGPFATARGFFFSPGGAYSPVLSLNLLLGFDF